MERRSAVGKHARILERLAELAEVASERAPEIVERALAAAREELGMDVAFVSEFAEQYMVFRDLVGDAESFGWREGESIPLDNTFCRLLMAERPPNLIPDTKNDARVKDLEVTGTAGIGSYVGIPVRFSDGRLYGTLCTLSHSPNPSLRERDTQFMRVLARMVGEYLEREELQRQRRRLEIESAGLRALLAALEARDGYSGTHSRYVVELAVEVAREMNLAEEEVAAMKQCALLHDVGKLAVADSILKKAGPLDAIEREAMRKQYRGRGAHSGVARGPLSPRPHYQGRTRALGRQGLSRRAQGRTDPALQSRRSCLRRLARHDLPPPLSRRFEHRRGCRRD